MVGYCLLVPTIIFVWAQGTVGLVYRTPFSAIVVTHGKSILTTGLVGVEVFRTNRMFLGAFLVILWDVSRVPFLQLFGNLFGRIFKVWVWVWVIANHPKRWMSTSKPEVQYYQYHSISPNIPTFQVHVFSTSTYIIPILAGGFKHLLLSLIYGMGDQRIFLGWRIWPPTRYEFTCHLSAA